MWSFTGGPHGGWDSGSAWSALDFAPPGEGAGCVTNDAGTGGPIDSTLFYSLYLYEEAFANFRMGYASALAWLLLVIIAIFTAIAFGTSKYWVYYEDESR
jgi:hypothetical protein